MPYVGVRALDERDAIYGRDWELAQLDDLLLARNIVLMHAPSGAGKTSLVQAGLTPLLKKRGLDVLGPVRPGLPLGRPLPQGVQTAYGLSMLTQLDDGLPSERRTPANELARLTIGEYLEPRGRSRSSQKRGVLLIDQFEEVLTVDRTDLESKRRFFQQLGDALREFDGLVLICMREDYVGALEPYLRYVPTRLATRFRLDLLGEDAALDAIRNPAMAFGVEFTEDAARYIWDSLCEEIVPEPGGGLRRVPGPYAEAVQLQVVCEELWQAPRAAPARITIDDVKSLGKIDDALGRFYSTAVTSAVNASGVAERKIRDWFNDRLITQGLRAQVMQSTDAMAEMPESAVCELVNAHVLHEELRRGLSWFEIAHDRLIEPILNNNKTWFETRRTALSERSDRYYQSGQTPDLLLSIEELAKAVPESRREEEFVRASRAARYAERGTNLAATGWGAIVVSDADPAILEALAPLLSRRRQEAGARYKLFSGSLGYRAGESAEQFLERHGATPGVADRARIPYYLLVVGSPEAIPFEFQYGLAMHHAVGRLDFDVPAAYATYARSIVMCEDGDFTLPRRLLVFAPRHEADRATGISARIVAQPMIERFRQSHPTWTCLGLVGETATKERLADAFGGQSAALAMCALCHGMQFRREDALQESRSGALICQDWSGQLSPDHYYGADDVPDTARLAGTMACLVATNSAGTPMHDEFSTAAQAQTPRLLADRPFVSALAKRLLSHPNGSALAVIGHVDRNWIHSLAQPDLTASTGLFESVMGAVLNGHTIGSAMAAVAQRTTFLYAALGEWYRKNTSAQETAVLRNRITAAIDARNFILLGDPAARLPLTGGQEVPASPMLPATASEEAGDKGVAAETPAAESVVVEDVVFAGVNGDSGLPAMPSMATVELAAVVAGVGLDRVRQDVLRQWYARSTF
jgi:hypothetical protein